MGSNGGGGIGHNTTVVYYAVFNRGFLIQLTESSEDAVRYLLGTNPEGTPADGMYKVTSLMELAELVRKNKK